MRFLNFLIQTKKFLFLVIIDKCVWKLNRDFIISPSFPKKIDKVFPNLPRRFKKIDAFYQSIEEGEIVIFSGGEYITYDPRGPIFTAYNLTRFTYDVDIKKIDAAMVWGEFKS